MFVMLAGVWLRVRVATQFTSIQPGEEVER